MLGKRLLRRLVLRLMVLVLVLIIAGLGVAWLLVDTLARSAIERGGTYALGVETTVEDVDLSLLNSTLRVDAMVISNPEGFRTPHVMRFDRFDFAIDSGSVFSDPITLHNIELTGLDINVEQSGLKSNINEILKNVRRFQSEPAEQKEEGGSGKRIKVDRLVINEINAHFHILSVLGGESEPITVTVPRIELEGLTSDNAKGILIGELFAKIIPAILEAVLTAGEGKVPMPTLQNLRSDLSKTVESLGDMPAKLLENFRREE